MSKGKKIGLWIAGGVGVLVVLVVIFLLLAPKLINSEPVREKVLAGISKKIGGKVGFGKVNISFLPLPRLTIHEATLSIPEKGDGKIGSLSVYPAIGALFRGKLRLVKLEVKAPDFKIRLGEKRQKSKEPESDAGGVLAPLFMELPDLEVVIKKGSLDMTEGESIFSFRNIDLRLVFPPKGLTLEVTCASNLWDRLSLKGQIDPKAFKGDGRLVLSQFKPEVLAAYLAPKAPVGIGDSVLDMTLDFRAEGSQDLWAEVQGSIPRLTLHRGDKKLVIKGKTLKGDFHRKEGEIRVFVAELGLDYPQLSLTGNIVMDPSSPQIRVDLEGTGVDVDSTRETVLALAGDHSDVRGIFAYVKGGSVPSITLKAQGAKAGDLSDLKNISIKGQIVEGKISIPEAKLDLENVNGEAIISEGVLQGENLEAQVGKSGGTEGTLRLGLQGDNAPFHLDIMVEADLAELPPILENLIDDKAFSKELKLIGNLRGSATGRLVLGESTGSIKPRVEALGFNLSTRYKRVPYPLRIKGGGFTYKGTRIAVRNLGGAFGKSTFSKLSGHIDWTKAPYFEVKTLSSKIFLPEIHRWLTTAKGSPIKAEDLRSVKGEVYLSASKLRGPLLEPQKWHGEASLKPTQVLVDSTLAPGPVELSGGVFHAIADTEKQTASFKDVQVTLLDASMKVSGIARDYFKGLHNLDTDFIGDIGPEADRWITNLMHLPAEIALRAPLHLSQGHLTWDKDAKTSFKGDLAVQDGPRVSLDFLKTPNEIVIKNLVIKDEESNASLGLHLKNKKHLSFEFSGHLKKTTLNRLFVKSEYTYGSLAGDFRAHLSLDQPMKSTAEGKLMGKDLLLPYSLKIPLEIDKFSLNAEKNHVRVEQAALLLGDRQMALLGDVKLSPAGFAIDMELTTDGIHWTDLGALGKKENGKKDNEQSEGQWDLPVKGTLRLKSGYFKYDQFTWSPFHADITFDRNAVHVAVTEARLCGISTLGSLGVTHQDLSLDFNPACNNQDLGPTLECLTGGTHKLTGKVDFKAEVRGRGKPDELLESVKGRIELVAKDGRIYKHVVLSNLLGFLNVTETFFGKYPGIGEEGFGFHSITVRGNLRNGKLKVEELLIDGDTMDIAGQGDLDLVANKIDLNVLVAPLKTVDRLIRMTPILRRILAGSLLSIPVKVSGDLNDPKVKTLPAGSVGTGLVGIIERTVTLPVKILEPVVQEDKKKVKSPE